MSQRYNTPKGLLRNKRTTVWLLSKSTNTRIWKRFHLWVFFFGW